MQNQPSQKPSSHMGRNIGIVVIVVLIITVAAIYAASFSQNVATPSSVTVPVTVTVTAINYQIVYPNGASSGFLGPSSQSVTPSTPLPWTFSGGQEFTYTMPLNNKASLITSHTITSISTNTAGFTVSSMSPSLPYTLGPGASVSISLTLTAPNTDYTGPVTFVISVE